MHQLSVQPREEAMEDNTTRSPAGPTLGTVTQRSGAALTRRRLLATALAAGAAAWITTGLWTPVDELRGSGDITYEAIRSAGGGWLTWHLLDGLGTALVMLALAFCVCTLAPTRGARWATIGAVAAVAGGLLFSTGMISLGMVGAYATEPDAVGASAGKALVAYANSEGGPAVAVLVPGFLLITLGQLLLATALWRSRAVPVWLPAAIVVANVVLFLATGVAAGLALALSGALYALVARQLWRTPPAPEGELAVTPALKGGPPATA